MGETILSAIEEMAGHILAGRLVEGVIEQDFDFLRHLMGRRALIVTELHRQRGSLRGPGTPGHIKIGG